MKTFPRFLLPLFVLAYSSEAQIRVLTTEVLPIAGNSNGYPRFSADGAKIYYTTQSYDGIGEFTIATRVTRTVTTDKGAGYNFALSGDGKSLSYRRNVPGTTVRNRRQEIISLELSSGSQKRLGSARSLSAPAYDGSNTVYMSGATIINPQPSKNRVTLIGIDAQKIVLLVKGQKKILDPLGNGSYIWPSLSPDQKSLAAYDMDRGAFVSDLDGNVAAKLGRIDAPAWTRDGKWLVGFVEQNDGHDITGSDLYAIRLDGSRKSRLTDTPNRVELFPSCSPVDNRIVCHTKDGRIVILTYEVTD